MPTHQSQGHFYDTLANALAGYYNKMDRPFVFRSANRLDRNTSGIVLVAKDRVSSSLLSSQMKNDKISKSYLAILQGELEKDEGTIETYIRRKEKSIILREVCKCTDDAKLAITKYRVLAKNNGLSLVEATPVTGRTHQLRVHFAHIGAQILGDDLYGNASPLISRHALHAYKLSFEHPKSRIYTELIAPVSDDMGSIIENNFGKDFLPDE
jgi:23S rRNA pseudouridine1911/1915/1917 synthase